MGVSLTTSITKLSSSLTFYHTFMFYILLSFTFLLLSHHTVPDDLTPFLFFLLFSNSSYPLPPFLSSVLFSLMDGANAHHQQRPSGGDSFLHLLTEGHNRPADIIHSFCLLFLDSSTNLTIDRLIIAVIHSFIC